MKNSNQYNRFILFANAPSCVYGNTVVRHSSKRLSNSFVNKCFMYFRRKSSG